MPSASDAHRARWNGPGHETATAFLESRGFTLSPHWTWVREAEPDEREWDAIDFMVCEWDYGGWQTPDESKAEAAEIAARPANPTTHETEDF